MAKIRLTCVGALTALLLGNVFVQSSIGQTSQDVDRAQLMREQAPLPGGPTVSVNGVEDGRAASSPNDSDLGVQEILKREETYQPFSASVGSPIYWTSNVALTNHGVMDDLITAPVAAFAYQPKICRTLYGFVSVRQQFFYYNTFNEFDFGALDVEAGLTYLIPQFHNLSLHAEYDFTRLTQSDRIEDEFFSNHALIFDAEMPFRFGRAQQVVIGADANVSVGADHQSPRRNDYEVYAGYTAHLTRALSLNAVGRVVVRDYHQNDRTDVSEVLSLTATYQLTPWWSVSAISSFARSDSNHDVFDYSVANVGGAMSLAVKF
jgi:hypothetical protein